MYQTNNVDKPDNMHKPNKRNEINSIKKPDKKTHKAGTGHKLKFWNLYYQLFI